MTVSFYAAQQKWLLGSDGGAGAGRRHQCHNQFETLRGCFLHRKQASDRCEAAWLTAAARSGSQRPVLVGGGGEGELCSIIQMKKKKKNHVFFCWLKEKKKTSMETRSKQEAEPPQVTVRVS